MDNKKPWTDTWRNAVAANMANAEPLQRRGKAIGLCAVTVVTALLVGLIVLAFYIAV